MNLTLDLRVVCRGMAVAGILAMLPACTNMPSFEEPAAASAIEGISGVEESAGDAIPEYLIGPYDELEVFVWRAEELSTQVTVRPDGRISTPLVEDMLAAGKTPTELANDIETALTEFVKTPEVTVIVDRFSSTFDQQVRVLGEAQQPRALPYQAGMTVLDVMLGVGGLTEFAAGNRAKLIRGRAEDQKTYRIRLNDLMRRGDVSANVAVRPGDVILIPETRF
jgi:polysaccharide export outer membrane protein